jgi:anti-sigma-K factor RskA
VINSPPDNIKTLRTKNQREQSDLSALGWRDAARAVSLAAALLIILIGGLLLKKNGHPDFQTVHNIALMEQQFMSDPKEDFRENSMYITEYNALTGELTIIRQTAAGDTTDTKVVVVK